MTTEVFTREQILEAITLEPCHVTGEHNPTHTSKRVCNFQRHAAFDRLLNLLDVTEDELPRCLHENCYWCEESRQADMLGAWANRDEYLEVRR